MVRASRLNADRPSCQDEACAIQSCLSQNSYNEDKCVTFVNTLYRCCSEFYKELEAAGGEKVVGRRASTTACPMKSVVDRKIRRIEAEEREKRVDE